MYYTQHPTTLKEKKEKVERIITELDLKYTRNECVEQLRDCLSQFARDGYPDFVMGIINDINIDCRQDSLKEYCEDVISQVKAIYPDCNGRVIYRGLYFEW